MAFCTLREMYLQNVKTFADLPAFSMVDDESLTYREFGERVESLIELLTQSGLSSGDKVSLLSTNMPNWAVAYFAVTAAGMVIVPILPDFSGEEINKIISHSESKALVVSDKLYAKVSEETVGNLQLVLRASTLKPIAVKEGKPGKITFPKNQDLAAIIYTSGTTSAPKGVMLSHNNLCAQVDMVRDIYPIHPEDIFMSILPLSHTYECSLGMIYPFSCGASVVYLGKAPTAAALLPALESIRPTTILSVPLIIEKIYRAKIQSKFTRNKFIAFLYGQAPIRKFIHRMAGKKLMATFGGRVRFFGVGGAKIDAIVERFLAEARFPYAIGYGLTETSPLLAGSNPSKTRLQSTGPILKGVEARLDNMSEKSGEGELVVRGPNIMMGYYKNPAATAESFTADGWFRTKDLCCFDKTGYLYIKGRLGNMIVGPSGENIYPEEIENVINGHALVEDSLVREEKGRLVAVVHFNHEELERRYNVMKEELGYRMESIKADLMHYVNSKVNKFSKISVVEEKDEAFEKTPTLKIKRFLYTRNKK